MLKLVKRCFLCVCCFITLLKTCTYSYKINRIDMNVFLFIPKKPFLNFLFTKKNFHKLSSSANKINLSKRNIDYTKFEEKDEKLKLQTWKNKSDEYSEASNRGNESKCNLKDKDRSHIDNERIRKWDVSIGNNSIPPFVNKAESPESEPKKSRLNEAVRKKMSELAKQRWKNEEERRKLLQSKKKFRHSEATKRLLSYKIKLKWKDENYRRRILEKTRSFNQDENTKRRKSKILKEKWKVEEFREKMLSRRKPFTIERRRKISEIIKEKWKSEDYKRKTLKAIRENYKKRKLQVGLNPDLNYIQNVMLFKQLGLPLPKMRIFPDVHIKKLRKKKRKKRGKVKQDVASYKENWKHIYDSILHNNESDNSLTYVNKIDNLSISGAF